MNIMKTAASSFCLDSLLVKGELTQPGFISLCQGLQVDAVELFDRYLGRDRATDLAALRDALAQTGMPVCCWLVQNDFTDPDRREENIQRVVEGISEAAFLGAPLVRVLGGSIYELNGSPKEVVLESLIPIFRKLAVEAEQQGVALILENHGDLPGCADELLPILEGVDSPYLKVCCDLGNLIGSGMIKKRDPLSELIRLRDVIAHVHVKDRRFCPGAPGDVARCTAGTGLLPLQDCMCELRRGGYSGYISCEFDGDNEVDLMTGFICSLANIRYAIQSRKEEQQ